MNHPSPPLPPLSNLGWVCPLLLGYEYEGTKEKNMVDPLIYPLSRAGLELSPSPIAPSLPLFWITRSVFFTFPLLKLFCPSKRKATKASGQLTPVWKLYKSSETTHLLLLFLSSQGTTDFSQMLHRCPLTLVVSRSEKMFPRRRWQFRVEVTTSFHTVWRRDAAEVTAGATSTDCVCC